MPLKYLFLFIFYLSGSKTYQPALVYVEVNNEINKTVIVAYYGMR